MNGVMAMEPARTKQRNGWSSKFSLENAKVSHKLPVLVEKPNVSYSALKYLCSIDGLGNREKNSSKDAHDTFMKSYSRIFCSSQEKLPSLKPSIAITGKLDNSSTQCSIQNGSNGSHLDTHIPFGHRKPHYCSNYSYSISHDIRDHLALLHKQHITQTMEGLINARIHSLRKLLKKLPFERKRSEQEAIFNHLQNFPELTEKIPLQLLRELSTIVQIEKWHKADCTVFADNQLYLILRGSVTPLNEKHFATSYKPLPESSSSARNQSGDDDEMVKLGPGKCFGTINNLDEPEGRAEDKLRFSSVVTLGPCEFLKISSRDFEKMKQLVESKETNQKLNLIQSCRLFENWPKVALNKIVDLIRWKSFRPGTVLVNEGESCQVIGFISEGLCLLKRHIDVAQTNRDGTKGRRQKQVTVGKLAPGDSFGECTVLQDRSIPYTIMTATRVQLGVISQHDFSQVDEVTKCLLSQCYEAIDNMSKEELQKQYMEQQKQIEWAKFKRDVLRDVIYHRSILPGYGKWSRNPTVEDVVNFA